jgi:hypothetical protein
MLTWFYDGRNHYSLGCLHIRIFSHEIGHVDVGTSHVPSRMLTNHILLLISTVLVFIQRSTNNQIQLLFTDQSALTAAATSLGSAHLDLYKRAQLPASNHQSVIRSSVTFSEPARLVRNDRSSESSALHCTRDGCLGPLVVMSNSPGNWSPRLAGGHTPHTG